jgi:Na+-driven multidrug efflux pump
MVAVFQFGVAGVAIATITSQYLSAVMILVFLARSDGYMKFSPKLLRLDWFMIKKMLYIGIPSGIQGSLFSLSNVMIQSSINSFGDVVMAGNTAAANLEGFIYIATNAIYQAALTFVGQNMGAKKYKNIKRIAVTSVACAVVVGFAGGMLVFFLRRGLSGLYTDSDAALQIAMSRIVCIMPFYFLCGVMEVLGGCVRGMGKSITTMIISLLGACAFRIAWVKILCALIDPSLSIHIMNWDIPLRLMSVYISYPISWTITFLIEMTAFFIIYRRRAKQVIPPLHSVL